MFDDVGAVYIQDWHKDMAWPPTRLLASLCLLYSVLGDGAVAQSRDSELKHAPKVYSADGRLIVDLTVQEWDTPGSAEPVVAYYWKGEAQIPGPTLVVKPGDDVVIRITNALPEGYEKLLNATALSVMGVQFERRPTELHESGSVSVHTFKIRGDHGPGLHWYHSPPSHALQALSGAIVVLDKSTASSSSSGAETGEGERLGALASRLGVQVQAAYLLELQYRGLPAANTLGALVMAEQDSRGDGGGGRRGRRELSDAKGLKPLDRPVGYMVNGQLEPLLTMVSKAALVLDMVHVGGRHVLELQVTPEKEKEDVMKGGGGAVGQAMGPPCTMHLLANDGVDYEAGRKASFVPLGPYKRVRVLLRCESPGAYSLMSLTDGDRAAIADPSRRWAQTLARIQVDENASGSSVSVEEEEAALAHNSVHVAPYVKDLSAESGPFLRYEADLLLQGCTPIAGKKAEKEKIDACTPDHRLSGRVPSSLSSSKTIEPSEAPLTRHDTNRPFHELTVHTSAQPPGVALRLSNGHPFQILDYVPLTGAHASGILGVTDVGDNPYLRHWGKYGDWHDVFPPLGGAFTIRYHADEHEAPPVLQFDAYPPYTLPTPPGQVADDDVVVGVTSSVGPLSPNKRESLVADKEGTPERDLPPQLLLDVLFLPPSPTPNATFSILALARSLESYLEDYLNSSARHAITTTADPPKQAPLSPSENNGTADGQSNGSGGPPPPASTRRRLQVLSSSGLETFEFPLPPPRRLVETRDESIPTPTPTGAINPACSSKSGEQVHASLSVQLGHSGHTYTVIRLLQNLLSSPPPPTVNKAADEQLLLPVLCGLNITLRHSALAHQQENADGGGPSQSQTSGHHSFLGGVSALHVGMILGIAASIVGLSLALAMHLAYRYCNNNGDDDKPLSTSMRGSGLRRSSSSFSRHRRRSSQAHDPTSIETNITELQETNPIHRMHSRSSSNVLNGPILFPPPKPQPLAANRNIHRSSSSLHDSVSGSGSGLSKSGSGTSVSLSGSNGANGSNGFNGPNGPNGKTGPLQGEVQPAPLNHSRSTSLPLGLWKHSASC